MFMEIDAKRLSGYLYREGPYIYYFREPYNSKNHFIVKHMNNLSLKFRDITVLEILWENQLSYNTCTPADHKYTIFLYFRSHLIKDIFEPKFDQIQNLFKEATKCYKIRSKRRWRNSENMIKQNMNNSETTVENKNLNSDQFLKSLFERREFSQKFNEILDTNQSLSNSYSSISQKVKININNDKNKNISTVEKIPIIKKPIKIKFVNECITKNDLSTKKKKKIENSQDLTIKNENKKISEREYFSKRIWRSIIVEESNPTDENKNQEYNNKFEVLESELQSKNQPQRYFNIEDKSNLENSTIFTPQFYIKACGLNQDKEPEDNIVPLYLHREKDLNDIDINKLYTNEIKNSNVIIPKIKIKISRK